MVIGSVTNPAGALTCAPGSYHVVFETTLSERLPAANTGCTHSGTNTTKAAIGLDVAFSATDCNTPDDNSPSRISHIASNDGNCRAVVISLSGGCACTITSVYAHVHNRGPGTCPQRSSNYCWPAGTPVSGSLIPLRIISGGVGGTNTSVTVQPNYTNVGGTVCAGTSGIHWGSPNIANGYLVVNVSCT